MKQSSLKLSQIRSTIRHQQLQSKFRKLRYEVVCSTQREELTRLINIPYEEFTEKELKELVWYAQKDHSNAILHLGNMVIDRFLTFQVLGRCEFKMGMNEYWGWWVNVMAQFGYVTEKMLGYILNRIAHRSGGVNLENVIGALGKCFRMDQKGVMEVLKREENAGVLFGLLNHMMDGQEKVFMGALGMVVSLTSVEGDFGRFYGFVVGVARLEEAFMHVSMKLMTHCRNLAVQGVNNFLLSGVVLERTIQRWICNGLGEKESVRLELSYLFVAIGRVVEREVLLRWVQEGGFVGVMQEFLRKGSEKYQEEMGKNIREAMGVVGERLFRRQRVEWKGEGMRDESEEMTEYHEMGMML